MVVIHSKPTKKIGSHFFPFSSALPLASPLLPLLPATQNQKSKPPSPQSSVRGPQPPPRLLAAWIYRQHARSRTRAARGAVVKGKKGERTAAGVLPSSCVRCDFVGGSRFAPLESARFFSFALSICSTGSSASADWISLFGRSWDFSRASLAACER